MTTIKSYSDKSRFLAIFRASLKQQLPIGIVSGVLSFLAIPLVYLVAQIDRAGLPMNPQLPLEANTLTEQVRYYFRAGVYLDYGQAVVMLGLLMLLALIVALMQSSYLHSKKMTDLYHSIPIRRPTLLMANSLAGVAAIFVPFLAVYLLTMIVQLIMYGQHLIGYGAYFLYIALDLLGVLVAVAGVYAFTVFIAAFVGTVFDNFALACVLGMTPLVAFAISVALWMSQTYGATDEWIGSFIPWLSPFTAPFLRFVYLSGVSQGRPTNADGVPAVLGLLAVWLVLAAAFYAAAVWGYNRRKSELSEQAQPQGVLQIIAKCVAAFCGAALFYAIFSEVNNSFTMVLSSLFGALLIGLLAELILSRGVRSLRKNLIWLAGSGLLFVAVAFFVRADVIGYVAKVPEAQAVESVTVSYRGRFERLSDAGRIRSLADGSYFHGNGIMYRDYSVLTDPESIAIITDAHRMLVDNKPQRVGSWSGYFDSGEEYSGEWLRIEYKLKDGSTMTRGYSPIYAEAYRMLTALETQEEFIRQNHAVFLLDELYGEGEAAKMLINLTVMNTVVRDGKPFAPTEDEASRILAAVRQDMLAETLPEMEKPSAPAFGYLELRFEVAYTNGGKLRSDTSDDTVFLSAQYTNTMAVLRELGMWDDEAMAIPPVDEVRLYPGDYIGIGYRFAMNKIYTLPRGNAQSTESLLGYIQDGKEGPFPSTADAAEITAILAAARNQMMDPSGEEVYVAAYYSEGIFLGGQLIRTADLPEGLRQRVEERFWSQEYTDNSVIYPETAMVAMMAATEAETIEVTLV